jgi:bacterioferritin-associated ferredoxin
MFVCLCNGFTDRQVRQVSDNSGGSAAEVYRQLGCRPRCGKCVPMVRDMVRATQPQPGGD